MGALFGKVALVTGASRGIGRATAIRLARAGARVVVNFASSEAEAYSVVDEIKRAAGEAIAVRADIGVVADVTRLFDTTIARFGRLDIFVANAGHSVFAPLAEVSEAEYDRTYAVNAKGTFFCLQQATQHLPQGGRIVCVSSIGTVLNMPGGASYFGSKAAVEQYCRVLAKELAPREITVNVISPGFTDTEMLRSTGGNEPNASAEIVQMTPLGRLGQPQEVAEVIYFLAAPEGAWINRQNLAVDGGIISR